LTSPFLTQSFIEELRDNQKLDLKGFAAKVQRKFNMCPNRYKLGRAIKAALNIIHGDKEEQFALLCDYGEELRRSNPRSKFFLTRSQIKEHTDPEPKEHLATLYWSYEACKRGFLEGCRPFICLDGCATPSGCEADCPCAWWITSPLGTPRGRYDEYNS
jgi:hypothetical protein